MSRLTPILILVCFLGGLYACVAPEMDGSKIKSNPDGSSKFGYHLTTGGAKKQIERALNSKGFKRYKADASQIIMKQWINISTRAAIATGVCFLGWLGFKTRFWAGATVAFLLLSFAALAMAELVDMIGGLLMAVGAIICIVFAIWKRDSSVIDKIKGKLWPTS